MPRVLVCSVGGQPAPVVGAIRKSAPLDLVFFLCSKGQGESGSVRILRSPSRRVFSMQCPFCERTVEEEKRFSPILPLAEIDEKGIRVLTLTDPDDLEEVLWALEDVDRELARRWPAGGVEVLANFTGGTKTMSLGLGIHALRRVAAGWRLQLNRTLPGGRTDLVRIAGGDHPVVLDLQLVAQHEARQQVSGLLERYRYRLAAERLAVLLATQTHGRRERAWLLRQHLVCQVEQARERLDFASALAICKQDPALRETHEARLMRLVTIVEALESPGRWPDPVLDSKELVDEIREHGRRELVRGRPENALICWVRAITLLARLRLSWLYGLNTSAEYDLATPESLYDRLVEERDALGRYSEAKGQPLAAGLRAWRDLSGFGGSRILDQVSWQNLARGCDEWLDEALEIL